MSAFFMSKLFMVINVKVIDLVSFVRKGISCDFRFG